MARPSKYNRTSIKEAYEKGFTKDEIVKKFKVSKAILTNKVNSESWSILCDVTSDINELNAKTTTIAQNYTQNPDVAEMFENRINTLVEDNKLIGRNRTLLSSFQLLISNGMRNGTYKTAQDIKAGVSAVADIEKVANPQASKQEINIQNTNAQQNITRKLTDFYEDLDEN